MDGSDDPVGIETLQRETLLRPLIGMWMVVMIQSELKLLTALSTKVGQKYVDGSDDPVGIETINCS